MNFLVFRDTVVVYVSHKRILQHEIDTATITKGNIGEGIQA